MIYLYTYTNHTTGLQAKLANNKHLFKQIRGSVDAGFWVKWAAATPVEQIGENSIACIQVSDLDLVEAIGFEILGQSEISARDAFANIDTAGQADVETAYDRTPWTWIDKLDGLEHTQYKSYNPGLYE